MEICLNNSSLPSKERFFQRRQKIKHHRSLHHKGFSTFIASNSNGGEKYSENTEMSIKEIDNNHSARRLYE